MSFGGGGGGSSTIAGSGDVFLTSPANNDVLAYNTSTAKWINEPAPGGSSPTYANLPAGTTLTILKSGSNWPARPTSRNDIVVQWKGADPSPGIVSSGTGGMLDNVDIRLITP